MRATSTWRRSPDVTFPHSRVGGCCGSSKNYVRPEAITRANARLVAAHAHLARAQVGGGEIAIADGLRFVVPIRTLNAAPNPKYFGRVHGATFFNFANDQFAGQSGVVVPGTPKDAPYLLAGLLEQWSGPPPTEIITDSGSYTDQSVWGHSGSSDIASVHVLRMPPLLCSRASARSVRSPRAVSVRSRSPPETKWGSASVSLSIDDATT
jgi:hypothetical protein